MKDIFSDRIDKLQYPGEWDGRTILILGAARQGLALARYLAGKGAQVILNDNNVAKKIEDACINLRSSLPDGSRGTINWVLGSHPARLLIKADLVCVSGGIPLDIPIIADARSQGIPVTNDSQIFLESVPCKVVGITGSAGKSTTTSLLGKMAQALIDLTSKGTVAQKVWIGGNIGLPLVDHLDAIKENDIVILELSSFQLELMEKSPSVSAILNITPNHLDRHGSMEAYTAAKRRILDFQVAGDTAVLGREDPVAWGLKPYVKGRLISFGLKTPEGDDEGTFIENEKVMLLASGRKTSMFPIKEISLRGEHNVYNVLAASAIMHAAGLLNQRESRQIFGRLAKAVRDFSGMPHRLELVRIWNGIAWYNDSIATSPERTIAAINSFDSPIVLMLGGRDKDLPWEKLSELIRKRVDHVILFGEAADKIFCALKPGTARTPYTLDRCNSLQEAVKLAASIARSGDVVLLSPGGTSFDEFVDFEDRGEHFRKWIHHLP